MTLHSLDRSEHETTAAGDPLVAAIEQARRPGVLASYWEEAWNAWSGRRDSGLRANIEQVHYKPFTRVRLLARVQTPRKGSASGTKWRSVYIQLYPDRETAASRFDAALAGKRTLTSWRPPVFEIPALNAVAWSLPNGPKLRILRSFSKRKAWERALRRYGLDDESEKGPRLPKLVRYVPRKRAVLVWKSRPPVKRKTYIKVYTRHGDEVAGANLGLLAGVGEERLGFKVPALLVHDKHRRAVLMSRLPGEPLTQFMSGSLSPDLFRRVGAALAGLHGSGLRPGAVWTVGGELESLARGAADLASGVPELAPRVSDLVAHLSDEAGDLRFPAATPIHANLFGDQVLVGRVGIGIVDWDDFAMGDPLYDVGRLLAHQIYVSLATGEGPAEAKPRMSAVLDAYAEAIGTPIAGERRLVWHVATAVVLRAKISALRPLVPDWPRKIARAVEAAEGIRRGDSPWLRGLGLQGQNR